MTALVANRAWHWCGSTVGIDDQTLEGSTVCADDRSLGATVGIDIQCR